MAAVKTATADAFHSINKRRSADSRKSRKNTKQPGRRSLSRRAGRDKLWENRSIFIRTPVSGPIGNLSIPIECPGPFKRPVWRRGVTLPVSSVAVPRKTGDDPLGRRLSAPSGVKKKEQQATPSIIGTLKTGARAPALFSAVVIGSDFGVASESAQEAPSAIASLLFVNNINNNAP